MRTTARPWTIVAATFLFLLGIGLAYRAVRDSATHVQGDTAFDDTQTPLHSGKFRFLALGDSYTIGEQVQPADRWPMQLASAVRSVGIDLGDPLIIARTGWTTGDLLRAMDQTKTENNYDLVILLIGVNNQFQHRSTAEYRQDFIQLLHRSILAAGNEPDHVLVLSIPDWGVMPFADGSDRAAIALQINDFNAIAKAECDTAHITFINITSISRQATTQPAMIARDGLHPSALQYKAWITLALPNVRKIF